MFPTRAMIFAVFIFFSVALTPLAFKPPYGDRIQITNVSWSTVEMAKSEDRTLDKQIDAGHKFKVAKFADDFDQRSQSQTDITGSAPNPTPSAAGSIDIGQSLAIEFPVAAYEPHKFAGAIKRPPLRRAKVAPNQPRRVSNTLQNNSEANFNFYKPVELPPPNFTNSAY
jgi:hypothetical protein